MSDRKWIRFAPIAAIFIHVKKKSRHSRRLAKKQRETKNDEKMNSKKGMAQWLAWFVLPDPAVLGSNPGIHKKIRENWFSEKKLSLLPRLIDGAA